MMLVRKNYEISGIVQGVGFRPAVYNLAVEKGLGGGVTNSSGKVLLSLEGEEVLIDKFFEELPAKMPAQSKIESISLISVESCELKKPFEINTSRTDENYKISIPADLAICDDCRREIKDSSDRRFKYPFTTCVKCGPRYTVVDAMPYDRCRTTLAVFPLCEDCQREYSNPKDRRFHAESIACPKCGPNLSLHDAEDNLLSDNSEKCLDDFKRLVKDGKIVAVKGIGGFLIACDAKNSDAIKTLRIKKNRPHKPFALMAKDIDTIKKYCEVTEEEESLLKSDTAPIVILRLKPDLNSFIPIELISPDNDSVGFMLPYSPLHELLFDHELDLMIMTSGNKGGEPICIHNEEAFKRLKGIAEAYLCHNREINLRNDDSLCVIQLGKPQIWRRARGYAPKAIFLKHKTSKNILAFGAELKNTITLAFDNEAVISPHIGDLETIEANNSLIHLAKALPDFYRKKLDVMVRDMHPDMHSSRLAEKIATEKNVPTLEIQHHHAHAVSCMAEHNLDEAIAVIFDGTGYGTDGKIWGAELLYVNKDNFQRLGTFKEIRLPGGDQAVFNPVRQLIARYLDAGVNIDEEFCKVFDIKYDELKVCMMQNLRGINAPFSHAAGRLFDSISALLGITKGNITYEGQGAIRLEREASKFANKKCGASELIKYNKVIKDNFLSIDWSETFRNFSPEKLRNLYKSDNYLTSIRQYAYEFHEVLADCALDMVEYAVSLNGNKPVVLSGGVFMNRLLNELVFEKIAAKGLKVFINEKVPPNDGGISFGQAVIASYKY